ncbi:MAG: MaoC family dehydratase [Bryobacteraceae bacterium]|nr:MaoC family dehydratase [Bryobacteraceae bacterium]
MTIHGKDELEKLIGQEVGVSGWHEVTQARIDQFAAATGDDQWIHTDPVRAAASPLGGTIAHGFLTLSLLSILAHEAIDLEGDFAHRLNYGLNRLRFTAPVRSGSRIRGRFVLLSVTDVAGGFQIAYTATVEIEGAVKPALVAEWLVRVVT